ncbi:hypothetical protein [Cupriavidus sp. RAF12]|uniref:hypothetical protein n=1 Tax=Cupriavidus sp. RAF12 TaxID=3233050 RepID=UPI003F8FB48A
MATQRPAGTRQAKAPTNKPVKAPIQRPAATPAKDRAPLRDLGADTTIWHTRGLQTNSRMRIPLVQRTPPRQLPPSAVPRLILWAVLLGAALVLYHFGKQMLR